MFEAIVLSRHAIENIESWQLAIEATGYGLELNTPIPFESLDGYVPVRWRKSASEPSVSRSGFECRHLAPAFVVKEEGFEQAKGNYSHAFALGQAEDPLAKMSLLIAACALAAETGGVVLLQNGKEHLPDDLLRIIADDDKYGWLPHRDSSFSSATSKNLSYRYNERPKTIIRNAEGTKLGDLKNLEYAVFVGRNNSGKSFVLKALTEHWGKKVSYLGPARYQNFSLLTPYTPTEGKQEQKWQQFTSQWSSATENFDNSPLNLQQAIAELSDDQRLKLKSIVKALLDVDLDFSFTLSNNDMSQKYVSCNGHNISFTSSGLRLIITVIVSLLDDTYDRVMIDEPELGISPEAQGVLSDFLSDGELRKKNFPHIKSLILATHSSVFLDRQNIRNNFIIRKSGDEISINKIDTYQEFNRIHFFLLGNRFETLYLPSAILLVEGKSDCMFIERVLSVLYPSSRFSVIAANGDGEIKRYLHITSGLLNGIQRSPYHDRLFVVLDSQHSAGLAQEISSMGVPKSRIIEWSKNGIEFFYPDEILDGIFGSGPEIEIEGSVVSRNGIRFNKTELAEKVCGAIRPETKMNSELKNKLLEKLDELRS